MGTKKIKISTEITVIYQQEIEVTEEELQELQEKDGDSICSFLDYSIHEMLMDKLDLDDWFHYGDFEDFEILSNE